MREEQFAGSQCVDVHWRPDERRLGGADPAPPRTDEPNAPAHDAVDGQQPARQRLRIVAAGTVVGEREEDARCSGIGGELYEFFQPVQVLISQDGVDLKPAAGFAQHADAALCKLGRGVAGEVESQPVGQGIDAVETGMHFYVVPREGPRKLGVNSGGVGIEEDFVVKALDCMRGAHDFQDELRVEEWLAAIEAQVGR